MEAARGKDGRNGGKLTYRVPVGTLAYEIKVGTEGESKHFIGDLDFHSKTLRIAKGG